MTASLDTRIFLVDDDVFYLSLLEQQLRNLGYANTTSFSSTADFLNNLHEKPGIVFVDYNIDALNGYDVLKKIKRFDPDIYVVMISSQEEVMPAVDALKHGAFDYLEKGSFDETRLKVILKRIEEIDQLIKREKPGLLRRILRK